MRRCHLQTLHALHRAGNWEKLRKPSRNQKKHPGLWRKPGCGASGALGTLMIDRREVPRQFGLSLGPRDHGSKTPLLQRGPILARSGDEGSGVACCMIAKAEVRGELPPLTRGQYSQYAVFQPQCTSSSKESLRRLQTPHRRRARTGSVASS